MVPAAPEGIGTPPAEGAVVAAGATPEAMGGEETKGRYLAALEALRARIEGGNLPELVGPAANERDTPPSGNEHGSAPATDAKPRNEAASGNEQQPALRNATPLPKDRTAGSTGAAHGEGNQPGGDTPSGESDKNKPPKSVEGSRLTEEEAEAKEKRLRLLQEKQKELLSTITRVSGLKRANPEGVSPQDEVRLGQALEQLGPVEREMGELLVELQAYASEQTSAGNWVRAAAIITVLATVSLISAASKESGR
jgi:hypothetical protein